jgi:EAL domain-containing protein (putative c-di-GMP-specific phosphodiesterase class I)
MSHTVTLANDLDRTRRTRQLIEELLANPTQLGPDFQPVRRFADGTLVAWKARGRGQPGSDVADTLTLLSEARSLGLVERLDWAFRTLAMDTALTAGVTSIHLTPEPETFRTACPPRLAVSFNRGRREMAIGAELHSDAFGDLFRLRAAVEEYRQWGWTMVLADVSETTQAEAALSWLLPEQVQVDLADRARVAAPEVGRLLSAATELGAEIMAVGVDTERDRDKAVALGATIGRGRLLGPAGPLPSNGPV